MSLTSERAKTGPAPLLSALQRVLAVKAARQALVAAGCILLVAILGFLYFKTQGADIKRGNEALAALRGLKEIDARWDVDIWRLRFELGQPQPPVADYGPTLARQQKELAAAAQALGSPVLARGLPDLLSAFSLKAGMVEKFRKASAANKQTLLRVMASDTEVAGLVRGSWKDFRDRERLVAAESAAVQAIAEAQRYYFAPSDAQRKVVETVMSDLRQAAPRLPPAAAGGVALHGLVGGVREAIRAVADGVAPTRGAVGARRRARPACHAS